MPVRANLRARARHECAQEARTSVTSIARQTLAANRVIRLLADRDTRRGGFETRPWRDKHATVRLRTHRKTCKGRVSNPPTLRAYIANNPAQWADDPDNITRAASAERGRV